jgi:C-terminal processing protease CtpA/Prc
LQAAGLRDGDFIIGINDIDVKWSLHDEVVSLIKESGNSLKLRVTSPMTYPSPSKSVCRI